MAFAIKDRVAETTVTTGTGTVTLLGAQLGFQSFSAIGNGNTTMYLILSGNGTDWETGIGTYTSAGTTLSRTTILSSSNSGSAISLVGTSLVMCGMNSHITDANGLFNQLFGSPANGNYNLTVTGGVWTVTGAGASATGGLFSEVLSGIPTAAGLGTLTDSFQTGGSRADTAAGVTITQTDSGVTDKLSFSRWAVPATPYTKKFLVQLTSPNPGTGLSGVFVGWTDNTKLQIARMISQTAATPMELFVSQYTNSTTFSSNPMGAVTYLLGAMTWISLADDGTNFTIAYSNDGTNYITIQTGTKSAGFLGAGGYTSLCFGVAANGAIAKGNLRSYS